MLLSNTGEVCEPYVYDYINSLSNANDSITHADGINLGNTLSLHLKAYVKTQLNEPEANDADLVAVDEPAENQTENQATAVSNAAAGKSKKDREKALENGELHDNLTTVQDSVVAKINKKKVSKKFKVKAWKEWLHDFTQENDAK